MVGGPVATAEITAKPQWTVKTGPWGHVRRARFGSELDVEKLQRRQVFGARGWAQERKEKLFFWDAEGAFGTESAIRGGLLWF